MARVYDGKLFLHSYAGDWMRRTATHESYYADAVFEFRRDFQALGSSARVALSAT